MCIIAWHPKGAQLISEETLHICWDNNDDGAGFAVLRDTVWHVQKGFMTWEAFLKAWKKADFNMEDEFTVHFRIGTSGGIKPSTTHPFPVCDDVEDMRELEYKADQIVFHNGVHSSGCKIASDTMYAVSNWIYSLLPYIDDPNVEWCLKEGLNHDYNKWFITNKEDVYFYGNWFEDEDTGNWYTKKDEYKARKVPKPRTVTYSNYSSPYTYNHIYGFETTNKSDKYKTYYKDDAFNWDEWEKNKKDTYNQRFNINEVSLNSDDSPFYDDLDFAKVYVPCKVCNITILKSDLEHGLCSFCNEEREDPDKDLREEGFLIADQTDGQILALVDQNGDIVWDDKLIADTFDICPNCMEATHIMESPYSDSDSLCTLCGAVFRSVDGEILRYDPDIKAKNMKGSS
jgi:hypothetical protein